MARHPLLAIVVGPLIALTNYTYHSTIRAQTSAPTLVADSAAPSTVALSAIAYHVRFTLTQIAADSATYRVACAALGALGCVATSADSLRLGPGQQIALDVTYRTTRAGRGLLILRVRDSTTGARTRAGLLLAVVEP